jgi:hypothetical protein
MRSHPNAVEHRDLPPKVASRARDPSTHEEAPVRHAGWLGRLARRAGPRHDLRTLARRIGLEARRLREDVGRFGRRLTA